MNFSEIKIELEEFDGENNQILHFKSDANLAVNVFFLVATEKELEDKWKVFSNVVAARFQNSEYMSQENKEFEKWNFYIIYVTKEKLSKELKNKIENDRFSSRKIVEDNFSKVFNDSAANDLIIKHITNTDLSEILAKTQDKIQHEYEPNNTVLWKLVHNDMSFGRDTDLQKQIIDQIIQSNNEN